MSESAAVNNLRAIIAKAVVQATDDGVSLEAVLGLLQTMKNAIETGLLRSYFPEPIGKPEESERME